MILSPPLWAAGSWVDDAWADGSWALVFVPPVELEIGVTYVTQVAPPARSVTGLYPVRSVEAL